ncbi:alpha/beta hydrolase [Actinomycetospora corticicola]|uniref:Alpha/beta hydrolase n=1 Tax=Actinomycetospora corticicola TaxID=663602 RepID=A0A7Y9DYB5_9PSEU|nr:alpha/beta hydrolase [Actinomycetospora corticicola]NYD37680.1 hypothetical protein [Actinomycetospora corticicola]
MASAKQIVAELGRPGPHQVLRGDLALVGLPGVLFTPASGELLPAVAFGHDWLNPAPRYLGLLRHLASWGIVVAAPDTERSPFASHRKLAGDLRTALDVVSTVRLGGTARGAAVSVDPRKLGLAGHGMGAAAAVLAAATPPPATRVQAVGEPYWESGSEIAEARGQVEAVATIALSESRPPAQDAARAVHRPGLHIAFGKDLVSPPSAGAEPVAAAWAGPSVLRTVKKASHMAIVEGRHWSDLVLDGKADLGVGTTVKALLTGFLLHHLNGEKAYADLVDGAVKGTEVRVYRESSTV